MMTTINLLDDGDKWRRLPSGNSTGLRWSRRGTFFVLAVPTKTQHGVQLLEKRRVRIRNLAAAIQDGKAKDRFFPSSYLYHGDEDALCDSWDEAQAHLDLEEFDNEGGGR